MPGSLSNISRAATAEGMFIHMCGRFTLATPASEWAALFRLDEAPAVEPRFNIAPTQEVDVVRAPPGLREHSGLHESGAPLLVQLENAVHARRAYQHAAVGDCPARQARSRSARHERSTRFLEELHNADELIAVGWENSGRW